MRLRFIRAHAVPAVRELFDARIAEIDTPITDLLARHGALTQARATHPAHGGPDDGTHGGGSVEGKRSRALTRSTYVCPLIEHTSRALRERG
jgi:hypothetical protein